MKSYTIFISALTLLLQVSTIVQARSSYPASSHNGMRLDFDILRNRKPLHTEVKQSSYDVLEMLDEGFLLIQGLLVRGGATPSNQVASWPGQNLDWNGDVRTNVELNMMGL